MVKPLSLETATPEPPSTGENNIKWLALVFAETVFTFLDVVAVDELPTKVP